MGSQSTLKADSLAVFEGTPRDPNGPGAFCKADSADGLVQPTRRFPMGAKAEAKPTIITRVSTMAEEQMEDLMEVVQRNLVWGNVGQ